MADYQTYPKPKADKTAGRSASKVSTAPKGQQKTIKGAMGKNQQTSSGGSDK